MGIPKLQVWSWEPQQQQESCSVVHLQANKGLLDHMQIMALLYACFGTQTVCAAQVIGTHFYPPQNFSSKPLWKQITLKNPAHFFPWVTFPLELISNASEMRMGNKQTKNLNKYVCQQPPKPWSSCLILWKSFPPCKILNWGKQAICKLQRITCKISLHRGRQLVHLLHMVY